MAQKKRLTQALAAAKRKNNHKNAERKSGSPKNEIAL